MRIRAAVLEAFGEPLVVQDVELDDPKAGEVLVRLEGNGRLPHGHLHRERRRPVGLRPDGARPRGRRGRGGGRRGRHQPEEGRPRPHPVLAAVPRVHPLPLGSHQPVPEDPRAAGQGLPPRRHDPAAPGRRADPPLHGLLGLRRGHGHARDRPGEGRPGRPARRDLHPGLRRHHRHRRGPVHREGAVRLDLRRLRRRPRRPGDGRRLPARRGRADHLHRQVGRSGSSWRSATAPPTS